MLGGKQNTLSLAEVWKINKSFDFCRMASPAFWKEGEPPSTPSKSSLPVVYLLLSLRDEALGLVAESPRGSCCLAPSLRAQGPRPQPRSELRGCPLAPPWSKASSVWLARSCCSCWIFKLGFSFLLITQLLLNSSLPAGSMLVLVTVQRAMH